MQHLALTALAHQLEGFLEDLLLLLRALAGSAALAPTSLHQGMLAEQEHCKGEQQRSAHELGKHSESVRGLNKRYGRPGAVVSKLPPKNSAAMVR
eukprot:scaffold422_cov247-Pinguiococcus_pyrenoidosus.AAC.2